MVLHLYQKVSPLNVFEDNDVIKESQYSTKLKYSLLIHFQEELIFGIQQSHMDQKNATM